MTESPNIMSIRELIDTAFGEPHCNVVHHKLIQTVLIILARQLRLLERRVEIEIGPLYDFGSATNLSVTEIKMHANVPRKRKLKPGGVEIKGGVVKGMTGGKIRALEGIARSKVPADGKSSKLYSETTTSSSNKTSSTAKSTKDKSPEKYPEKTGQEKSYVGKSSTDKSLTDKSSTDKTTTEKSTTDKSSTEKTFSDKTSTEKSSTEKSTDKSSTDPTSTDKTSSSATKSSNKTTTTSSGQPTDKRSSTANYLTLLEKIEEQRERQLRVIRQRADSREEHQKTPTPMASMESMEKQYEKLLIVQRVPADEAILADGRSQSSKVPRLSIVTQDEFEELVAVVRDLQRRYIPAGTAGFPENAQLLNDLRKGASLTDAMAALQLSARLEAAEKALEKMLSLVTDLASNTPGVDVQAIVTKSTGTGTETVKKETEVIFGADGASRKSTFGKDQVLSKSEKLSGRKSSKESLAISMTSRVGGTLEEIEAAKKGSTKPRQSVAEGKDNPDWITADELDTIMQEMYDDILKMVNTNTTISNTNANNALKIANRLEGKLDESLNLGDRMIDLEKLVSDYADQITTLDTGLSSQMTNYQEQLTQMQHDLESGVETMQEALANTGGDTAAVAELNNNFTNLQTDFDIASMRQRDLRDIQDSLALDLKSLWKQIEVLRDTKSDRDEVADALRDKAGLAALNGLVSRQEFDAVRGDFEKRIGSAYDKFNNQEVVWQKAIDELLRELSEKADYIQVISLQDSIAKYLDKFNSKIHAMMEIVGEPRAAAISRKMFRDAACLCCATPAHLDNPKSGPSFPGFPSSQLPAMENDGRRKPGDDGDHGVCYPGFPVPHPVDPRTHLCHRFCGGSHTMLNNTVSRAPPGMIISNAVRQVSTAVGSDGKTYMVDDTKIMKPCKPCNFPKVPPTPLEAESAPEIPEEFDRVSSGMTPLDYRVASIQMMTAHDDSNISMTPPPREDDD